MNEAWKKLQSLITLRTTQIIIISLSSMVICQFIKFIVLSIRAKKLLWNTLITTGGFPSAHTALCVTMCITLGMFQWRDLEGKLDWSFAVAVILSVIIIHDAMGVRLEASKHAKILNNMVDELSETEKKELGYGDKGKLKEMLGHKGYEVLGGCIIGIIVGLVGFFLFV